MIYIDTSALVPIFIREPKSDAVITWIESATERLAISEWSLVEFASAASIKTRTGQVMASLVKQATARVRDFAYQHCTVAVPGRDEFRRAAQLAGNDKLKLRAGDALHIAIAERVSAQTLFCLDETMAKGAKLLGMNVLSV
jgi:hypothetical protein